MIPEDLRVSRVGPTIYIHSNGRTLGMDEATARAIIAGLEQAIATPYTDPPPRAERPEIRIPGVPNLEDL